MREKPADRLAADPADDFWFGSTRVSRETADRLVVMRTLVLHWNRTIRLISRGDVDAIDLRHIANSLALLPMLRRLRPRTILDIGSGAGFPGLVIAIATGLNVTLVDADHRKSAFLREANRQLGTGAVVRSERIEDVSMQADVVTSRAFAPLHRMWPIASRLLGPRGRGLFLYGESVVADAAGACRHGLIWQHPNGTVLEVPQP